MAKLLGIITPVPSIGIAFNIFLADRDALQNEPDIESMQYCNCKLLNVFEDSAQRVRTIGARPDWFRSIPFRSGF